MVVASFQLWWMVLIYLLALVALAFHLSHGVYSAQQTLGFTQNPKQHARAKGIGHVVAALVVVGFAIPPLSILFGLVK
jgi:succinate dehydrogenase / fumarate reductase cytochrome b subunit